MREFLNIAIKIVLIIVIVSVVLNDAGVMITNYWQSSYLANDIAKAAAINYKLTGSTEQSQAVAEDWADQKGVRLTDFNIEKNILTVTVKIPPKKTYIIRHIKILQRLLPTSKTVSADVSPDE